MQQLQISRGRYLITDPAYALSDDLYEKTMYCPELDSYKFNGREIAIFTVYADGGYIAKTAHDQFDIGVDTGRIAIIDIGLWTQKDDLDIRDDIFANELFFKRNEGLGKVFTFPHTTTITVEKLKGKFNNRIARIKTETDDIGEITIPFSYI